MPDTPQVDVPFVETEGLREGVDHSGATDFFKRFQKVASNVTWESAFNPLICGPYEFRKLLDPFFDKLDFVSQNVYELQESGRLATELKAVFDVAMNNLLKGDWQKLTAKGADWNAICLAIHQNIEKLGEVFGLNEQVREYMDQWFAYYRQHGTSLEMKRERRDDLNREALGLHMGSSYARLVPESTNDVEKAIADNKRRLSEVNAELQSLGDDPSPEYNGAFTRAYHRAMGNEIIEPKVVIQSQEDVASLPPVKPIPQHKRSRPSLPDFADDVKLEEASPWTETKKNRLLWEPKKKEESKGFFGKLKKIGSTIAGWFGR